MNAKLIIYRKEKIQNYESLKQLCLLMNIEIILLNEQMTQNKVKDILNKKLASIQSQIESRPKITITYFVPDIKKSGGKYQTITGNIRKIDDYNKIVILMNGMEIPVIEIIDIIIWGRNRKLIKKKDE